MWPWRRRRLSPPVLLPALDRLAELIERVVALLDQVSLAPEPASDGWLALVPSPEGYRLLAHDGAPPARLATVELELGRFVVLRLGPSPLPGDLRRCAFVERQEPPSAERTFDG